MKYIEFNNITQSFWDSLLFVSHSIEYGIIHRQNDDVDAVRPQVSWSATSVEITNSAVLDNSLVGLTKSEWLFFDVGLLHSLNDVLRD